MQIKIGSFLSLLLIGLVAAEEELKIEKLHEVPDCARRSRNGDEIQVHYTGTLLSGKVFDSSVDRGVPISFPLGGGRVIQGWDLGLLDMCVGDKRKLTIPYNLAYGESGRPPVIPAKATLIFETELMGITGQDYGQSDDEHVDL